MLTYDGVSLMSDDIFGTDENKNEYIDAIRDNNKNEFIDAIRDDGITSSFVPEQFELLKIDRNKVDNFRK